MATIRKKRNKWQVVIRRKNHPTISKMFFSKHDASTWARESELQIAKGLYHDLDEAHRTKLKELLERYVREVSPKKKCYDSEKYKYAKLMRMKIANYSLAKLTPTKIAKFRDALSLDVGPATVNKYLSHIQVAINHARREWGLYLPINPCEGIKRMKEPEQSMTRISDLEYNLLRNNARRSKLKCLYGLITFAWETGARRGECLKLKRSDVNFKRGTALLRDTKNGADRTIGLSTEALSILNNLPVAPDGRYFPTNADQFKFYWKQLKRWTGVDKTFHTIRAEFATRRFEDGWDITMVARQGGWVEYKALKRYVRISAEHLAEKLKSNVVNIK